MPRNAIDHELKVWPEYYAALAECIGSGEPFYCHESCAVPDPEGFQVDRHGKRYRYLPFNRWRLCRAWMNAHPDSTIQELSRSSA